MPFEAELADFATTQAERESDPVLKQELLAVAAAHRHHGESLGTIPCHEQDELPMGLELIREKISMADTGLGESDPVALVIRKQEAAAEFYIALASLMKVHAARDALRDMASEEIALSQKLCDVVNPPEDEQVS
jgi:hypothetical protein